MVNPPIDVARIPNVIPNLIGGKDAAAADGRRFSKLDPATGREICQVARSGADDIGSHVQSQMLDAAPIPRHPQHVSRGHGSIVSSGCGIRNVRADINPSSLNEDGPFPHSWPLCDWGAAHVSGSASPLDG